MTIQIKNRATGEVIREGDSNLTTVAQVIEEWVAEFRAKNMVADLRYANLRCADLRYADLHSADLSYADLSYADLRYADLRYANLRCADLRYADLHSADLSYADLSYANLRCANLRCADLRSANLHDLGQDIRGYRFFLYFEPEPVIRAGCREFGIEKAREHWSLAHSDNPILRSEILGKLAAAKLIIEARAAVEMKSE